MPKFETQQMSVTRNARLSLHDNHLSRLFPLGISVPQSLFISLLHHVRLAGNTYRLGGSCPLIITGKTIQIRLDPCARLSWLRSDQYAHFNGGLM